MNVLVPNGRRPASSPVRRVFLLFGLPFLCFVSAFTFPTAAVANDSVAAASGPEPAVSGSGSFRTVNYRGGAIALTLPRRKGVGTTFRQPLRGTATVPTEGTGWPVVVFLHGRHATCHDDKGRETIPFPGEDDPRCPDGRSKKGKRVTRRIDSHSGYQYLAERLAARGYFVISADANLLASYEYFSFAAGIKARSQLVGATLDLAGRWADGSKKLRGATPGDRSGAAVKGKLDLSRIALAGHSRGGEAVTQFVAFNRRRATVYPLDAVVAVGPTATIKASPFRNGGTNLAELVPGCDGDVTDLQGAQTFERVKDQPAGRDFAKYQWLVEGADHNWFNTVWKQDDAKTSVGTGLDSACDRGSPTSVRLSRAGQRAVGLTLINRFIRAYSGDESEFLPALEAGAVSGAACGRVSILPCAARVRTSYIAPAPARRLVLGPDRGSPLTRNEVGGEIIAQDLDLEWCDPTERAPAKPVKRCPGYLSGGESVINRSWAPQLVIDWTRKSRLVTSLPPAAADASSFRDLVVRAVVTLSDRNPVPEDPRAIAEAAQRLDVVLTDLHGNSASVPAESYSPALRPTLGDRTRQLLLSDIRMPLTDFAGIDRSALASVAFEFGNRGRTQGQIQIADLAFQGPVQLGPAADEAAAPGAEAVRGPAPGPGTAIDALPVITPAEAGCDSAPKAELESGIERSGGRLRLGGVLRDEGCAARVEVTLFDRDGTACRFVTADGDYGRPRNCENPVSLLPGTGEHGGWSLALPWPEGRPLPEVEVSALPSGTPPGSAESRTPTD